jgi:hypothetical protein
MPTFLRIRGFRFYVYAQEGSEPPHVHIDHGSGTMKVWLDDLSVAWTRELKPTEIRAALRLTRAHRAFLLKAWHDWNQRKS